MKNTEYSCLGVEMVGAVRFFILHFSFSALAVNRMLKKNHPYPKKTRHFCNALRLKFVQANFIKREVRLNSGAIPVAV